MLVRMCVVSHEEDATLGALWYPHLYICVHVCMYVHMHTCLYIELYKYRCVLCPTQKTPRCEHSGTLTCIFVHV